MKKENVREFNEDISKHGRYVYTDKERLSCKLVNDRLSKIISELVDLSGKTVIDIGCGDGTFTNDLFKQNPKYLLGIDAAEIAVNMANQKYAVIDSLEFQPVNVYDIKNLNQFFDIAIVRGVIHHLPDPEKAIAQIVKIAKCIIIIEPNGYNPILKIIEKTSKYHITHEEKSYFPHVLDKWVERGGGKIWKKQYAQLIPTLCPDFLARILNAMQPIVESIPLVRNFSCGVYVQKIVNIDVI